MAEVRKAGTNITGCIEGFRILNILKRFGVYDEFDQENEEEATRVHMPNDRQNIETGEIEDNNTIDEDEEKDEEII